MVPVEMFEAFKAVNAVPTPEKEVAINAPVKVPPVKAKAFVIPYPVKVVGLFWISSQLI
jgi:hypothetical protein